ncbi:MAG: hypothetical protein AAGE88_18155 [Actinomycetota bacterium]
MTLVAGNVHIGVTGGLFKAPLGTALPTDATTALAAAFIDLGYTSEDGVSEQWDDSVDDIVAWQNATTVRSATTESTLSIGATPIEMKREVLEMFHRGSVVTEPSAGVFQLDVKPVVADPSIWALNVIDGTSQYRLVIGRGEVVQRGEVMYRNGEPIGFPILIRAYPDANGNLMQKFSNDVAWDPV